MPYGDMGTWQGAPPFGNRGGTHFQGIRILHHRLPQRGLQTGRQEGQRRWWISQNRIETRRARSSPRAGLHSQDMKICTACNTENDDTRVFCLECGQRLPQSVPGSPAASTQKAPGASAPALPSARSVKKPLPRKSTAPIGTWVSLFFNLLFWAVLAGLVFGIYLVSQAPGVIRPAVEKDAAASAALAYFFRKASTTPGGAWMGSE